MHTSRGRKGLGERESRSEAAGRPWELAAAGKAEEGAGASHPPGPARSSRLQPGRLPGLRRGRAGPSPASRTAVCVRWED